MRLKTADLVVRHQDGLLRAAQAGPVLDVACGDGRNGLYLAQRGARVLLVDQRDEALSVLDRLGGLPNAQFQPMDLESGPPPGFPRQYFGAVLVFRYLYRPLIPILRDCLVPGGMLLYETYMLGQERHGRPRNTNHLLRPGELLDWFGDWEVLEHFENGQDDPPPLMGRIACRKPSAVASGAGS